MRPRTLVLVSLVAVLSAFGIAGWWYLMAARWHEVVDAWLQRLEARGYSVTHSGIESAGFPTDLRLTIEEPEIRWGVGAAGNHLKMPLLRLSSPIWNPDDIDFAAPKGIALSLRAEETIELSAATLNGTLRRERDTDGRRQISVRGNLTALGATAPWAVQPLAMAKTGSITVVVPEALLLSTGATEMIQVESRLDEIVLEAETPLGSAISHALFSSELTAPLPSTWSAPALSGWRDRDGQITIHHGAIEWGPLTLEGAGELSLDMHLRPEGALDIRARGYEAALDAFANEGLVAADQLPAMKLALAFISQRPTPDGPPEVSARLELSDGWLSLGPFRLAPLPNVAPE